MERRFIEEDFPINDISKESAKEKNIHSGNISSMHIWWARRPLSASRATIYSALIDYNEENNEKIKKNIIEISKFQNSNNKTLMSKAEKNLKKSNNEEAPKILDPFAGGGSIPLEALRLGCDVYASDYNPVAVLLNKCLIEFPQKFNNAKRGNDGLKSIQDNVLLDDIIKWNNTVFDNAKKELEQFFPKQENTVQSTFLWARTIPCQNPKCGVEIPLIRQFWLSKKKKIALYPIPNFKQIEFKIIGECYEKWPENFEPSNGTVTRGIVRCINCGYSISGQKVKELFTKKKSAHRLIAIANFERNRRGKNYRVASQSDNDVFSLSEKYVIEKITKLKAVLGMEPIPDEPLPPKESHRAVGSQLPLYGFKTFGDLFNSRQILGLLVFCEKIRESYSQMISEGYDKEYAKAIVAYLALGLDRLADRNSTLSIWNIFAEKQEHTYGRQTLPMIWDYAETNIIDGKQGWQSQFDYILRNVKNFLYEKNFAKVSMASATKIDFKKEYFDAVITDPPYYDNVPYSYLSDFFYVWLKRCLKDFFPELFATPLTPKTNEIVAYAGRDGKEGSKKFFEDLIKESFKEIFRVLKNEGIAIIVFAHQSLDAWETIIKSLFQSGFVITATWPIDTEKTGKFNTQRTAALASSIYIVCKKFKKEPIGFDKDVKKELKKYLEKKLEQLWNEKIRGSDFFISSIGSAMEVYGKYEKVLDDNDEEISTSQMLFNVRKIVTDFALQKVISDPISSQISGITRFYIIWRWAYGENKVPYDDARKLSQSIGIDLPMYYETGLIVSESGSISLVGPHQRKFDETETFDEMIDVIQKILIFWQKNERKKLELLLNQIGSEKKKILKTISKAISESLPLESTERKWIDGFLTGFRSNESQDGVQSKLVLDEET